MSAQKDRKRLLRFLDGLFVVLLGIYVFYGMTRVPYHGDESTLIRLSMDFAYIFQDHSVQKVVFHPASAYWSEEQYQRVLTGAVDPLTIGLAWSIAGMDRGDLNGFWRWYPPGVYDEWDFNVRQGNMPTTRLLDVARIPSTLFTAASIVLVFLIALQLSRSRPAAWIAAFLYATSPSILVNGRRSMQEGAMLFFTALVVFCGLLVARELRTASPRGWRIAGGYGLLGLASGCALASKHSSALIVMPVFLVLLLLLGSAGREWPLGEKHHARLRLLFGWLGSGLLGLSVFYILMPVWWGYPLHWLLLLSFSMSCFLVLLAAAGRRGWILPVLSIAAAIGITVFSPRAWSGIYQPIRIIAEARAELMGVHETLGMDLPSFGSRIGEMGNQLLFAKTQYYESLVWDSLEEEQSQIRTYEDSHLDGRGGGTVWGVIILVLAAGGLCALFSQRRGWEAFFLFLWFSVPAAALLIINPLAWQRYYLLLIAPWSVLAGFAAVPLTSSAFVERVRKMFNRKVPPA